MTDIESDNDGKFNKSELKISELDVGEIKKNMFGKNIIITSKQAKNFIHLKCVLCETIYFTVGNSLKINKTEDFNYIIYLIDSYSSFSIIDPEYSFEMKFIDDTYVFSYISNS